MEKLSDNSKLFTTNNKNQFGNTTHNDSSSYTQTFKNNYTNTKSHFINIPVDDSVFLEAYNNLCEELKCTPIEDFYPELLQKGGKIHMTVCVLDLGEDEEKISQVHSLLTSIENQIKLISNGEMKFNFDKFESMGSLTSTRVIYAKMKEDEHFIKLRDIIHLIKTLVDGNIKHKSDLKINHIEFCKKSDRYSIKLHMTLFNTLFLNKVLKKRKEKLIYNINATKILEFLDYKLLPEAVLDQIHFSRMRENKLTEKYEMIYSYKLN